MSRRALLLVLVFAVLLGTGFPSACGEGDGGAAAEEAPDASGRSQPSPEPSDPPTPGFRDASGADIPAYGVEGGAAEREEAEGAIAAYLAAYRAQAWAQACGQMSSIARLQLVQLIAKLKKIEKKTCAEALRLTAESAGGGRAAYTGSVEVVALRLKSGGPAGEGAGFALFHGENGKDYWVVMRREGGQWRVGSTVPQPFS